ncbi:MAG: polysaccharide pyruvyl transferase family protein [Hespellia sp.]|nr:polysaccharide pyruvyl transferase family protein [Hespellia sp.]
MKKNIFVVTWYKSINFGTCLQAYATHKVLKNRANVVILNHRSYYSLDKLNFLIEKLFQKVKGQFAGKNVPNYSNYSAAVERKMQKVDRMADENYKVRSIRSRKDVKEIDTWTDCYLVGSDQMWNPWMLSPQYLLDFVPRKRKKPKYSYAASFGIDNIPEKKGGLYKKYLPQFSKITVREPRGAELVKELSGQDATVVLDPTFLLTPDEWREFADQSEICKQYGLNNDYILCYFIGAPEFNHLEKVKQIADALKLKVVLIPIKEKDYMEENVIIVADACAYDFVTLIDNAKLVCTDSFHAVVFSFLTESAFYDFPRFKKGDKYSQEARLQNIMGKFMLEGSYWSDNLNTSEIEEHFHCDYTQGHRILKEERERSLRILYEMIEAQ